MNFSSQERIQYFRQLLVWGEEGQHQLKQSRVLIVGLGGLGSPVALYLAAAGVGFIKVVDSDVVDRSNLQRQILFSVDDLDQPKAKIAKWRLEKINPFIQISEHQDYVTAQNVRGLFSDVDYVLDCTDNFPARYLIHDACYFLKKKLVQASVYQWEGVLGVFSFERNTPCYRCLYPQPPESLLIGNCAQMGVVGVVPGVVGSLQAFEAIRWIQKGKSDVLGKLKLFDGLNHQWHEIRFPKNQNCCLCGPVPLITDIEDVVEARCPTVPTMSPEDVKRAKALLIDIRESSERNLSPIEDSIHMPFSEFRRWDRAFLKSDQKKVFVCASGMRAHGAVQLLLMERIPHVYVLKSGVP